MLLFIKNIYGTIELTEKMINLIEDKGKIITLGSTAGVMSFKKITNESIKNRFSSEDLTKEELFALAKEFEDGVAKGNYAENGWPKWGYGISKLVINLYHKILAKNAEIIGRGIQVNVCCPGYVKTNMTSYKGHLTVEQGILTPIFLIERPFEIDQTTQGRMFYECKPISFFGNE
jgi:NAD(P)-dependent dehydrogenase (short-subunit alcohol dehydrogenase family)